MLLGFSQMILFSVLIFFIKQSPYFLSNFIGGVKWEKGKNSRLVAMP